MSSGYPVYFSLQCPFIRISVNPMLARFSVQNFLSFDEMVEFSMLASKESQHVTRVAEGGDFPARVLQTAAIWGANASGKTNFTGVFGFAQFLVVHGTRADRGTGRVPFKLRPNSTSEPSIFEFDIIVEFEGAERMFRFRFGVTGREVTEESLVEIRSVTVRVYFSRKSGGTGSEHVFDLAWWERKAISDEERMFARILAKGTRTNQLFLHEAMDRNLTLLAPIYRWFQDQLTVLSPNADHFGMETLEADRQELRDYVGMVLNRADTGVDSIAAQAVPLESLPLPPKEKESILSSIKEAGSGLLLRAPTGQRFSLYMKEGEPVASRIVTYRTGMDGVPVLFETNEESDGTLRLLDLCPLFLELASVRSRKVYIIDELDRSMHALLTMALLKNHLATRSADTRTQLIFTTHDMMLMTQELFRRDEMWFIERGSHGQTEMECLSDYKDVRYDKDVRKAYLEGRFSGVPHLKPFGGRMAKNMEPTPA